MPLGKDAGADEKRIWITWESQTRNLPMATAMNAKLFELDLAGPRFIRYSRLIVKTLSIFRRERPELIFAQNPSIVLACLAVIFGRMAGIPVVLDAHNAGIVPFGGSFSFLNRVAAWLVQAADLTIVSNEALARVVSNRGGSPFVLTDPIPNLEVSLTGSRVISLGGRRNVMCICSYAEDEPFDRIIEAARLLSEDIWIFFTGNPKLAKRSISGIPPNVIFTGFLTQEQYEQMLLRVDLVIDLTTRRDCLLCGAYEAVAAGRALLTSDTEVLRSHFSKGTLYTDNSSKDIARKIMDALEARGRLELEMKTLKEELIRAWESKRSDLQEKVSRLQANFG